MRTARIKISEDEARCLGQVLSAIEDKFKYDEISAICQNMAQLLEQES